MRLSLEVLDDRRLKKQDNLLGAKNNDSLAEKQAIAKIYTSKYPKSGNSE